MVVATSACLDKDYSEIGRVIQDCEDYLFYFYFSSYNYIYREANGVSYRLAHLTSRSYIDNSWFDEMSSIIEDVLFEDLCNSSQR